MVVFFLQIAKVLPVLTSPELAKLDKSGKSARFCRDIEAANRSLTKKDTRSVGDLLREFFTFYGWQFDRRRSCICVRSGKLKSFPAKRRRPGRANWFVILDPFESNQNTFIPNDMQDTRRVARDLGSTIISFRALSNIVSELRIASEVLRGYVFCADTSEFINIKSKRHRWNKGDIAIVCISPKKAYWDHFLFLQHSEVVVLEVQHDLSCDVLVGVSLSGETFWLQNEDLRLLDKKSNGP